MIRRSRTSVRFLVQSLVVDPTWVRPDMFASLVAIALFLQRRTGFSSRAGIAWKNFTLNFARGGNKVLV